ncbi:tape measure protein, partial [Streptococcus equi]
MPGTFDGSIFADVGANTKDYEQAMARIVSTTQNAFRKAQDTAVNSSNKMVQIIGQIMAQLANNGESLGKRLGSAYATGLKLSIGEIQRIAASIGEKIPEPIKNGFNKAFSIIQNSVQKLSSAIPHPIKSAFTSATSAVVSFSSKITSAVSAAFNSVSSKASTVADKISSSFGGRITSAVTNLATKLSTGLSNGFSRMSSSAATSLNGISQKFANTSSAGERLKSTVMSIVQAFSLMAVAQKAMHALTGAIGGAVSRVDTMNRFPKTMALFGYSAEQSKASIDKLSKGIEGLPTPLDSAVKSAQQLAITTGSLDKGTSLALAFNNAMIGYGATTEGAEQALRQFNQSLGSGKIQAEEFNSVSEAAPGLMSKMAEAFGFGKNGVQDLKSALSDGKITAQEFADKMIELNDAQGGFAEMAQSSAGGIRTAWKNVHTAVVKGVAGMISAFDEAAKANGMKTIAETLL